MSGYCLICSLHAVWVLIVCGLLLLVFPVLSNYLGYLFWRYIGLIVVDVLVYDVEGVCLLS